MPALREVNACTRCKCRIQWTGEAWVVIDDNSSADGLSYCPPDPDANRHRDHTPRRH